MPNRPATNVTRWCQAELLRCRLELNAMNNLDHRPISRTAAILWSGGVALYGNFVVIAGRLWGHHELITLCAVPIIGIAGAFGLHRRGWDAADLGIRKPASEPPNRVVRALGWGAAALACGLAAAAFATGDGRQQLEVARMVIGTACGEELVHRGVVLGVWASTKVSRRGLVAANMVTFGLWHLAGAFHEGFHLRGFHLQDVLFPAAAASVLLWARLRGRSLLPPIAIHAGADLLKFRPWA